MSDVFLGEVRLMGFNFAPSGWAQASGQTMAISTSTALFSLLGTFYGGNGVNTFALPNLQGQCAVGQGQGPGLSDYVVGEQGGSETVTVLISEMPSHIHTMNAGSTQADLETPAGCSVSKPKGTTVGNFLNSSLGTGVQLAPNVLSPAASGLPHNNMMPYLVMNWCIALTGIFPTRS